MKKAKRLVQQKKSQLDLFLPEKEKEITIKKVKAQQKEPETIVRKDVKLKGVKKITEKEYSSYLTFKLNGIYFIEVEVTPNKYSNRKVKIVYKKTNQEIKNDKDALKRIRRELHTKNSFKIKSVKKLKFLGYGVAE